MPEIPTAISTFDLIKTMAGHTQLSFVRGRLYELAAQRGLAVPPEMLSLVAPALMADPDDGAIEMF